MYLYINSLCAMLAKQYIRHNILRIPSWVGCVLELCEITLHAFTLNLGMKAIVYVYMINRTNFTIRVERFTMIHCTLLLKFPSHLLFMLKDNTFDVRFIQVKQRKSNLKICASLVRRVLSILHALVRCQVVDSTHKKYEHITVVVCTAISS